MRGIQYFVMCNEQLSSAELRQRAVEWEWSIFEQ